MIRFLWMQETVTSMKEPVGVVFLEERTELAKESSESESQGSDSFRLCGCISCLRAHILAM